MLLVKIPIVVFPKQQKSMNKLSSLQLLELECVLKRVCAKNVSVRRATSSRNIHEVTHIGGRVPQIKEMCPEGWSGGGRGAINLREGQVQTQIVSRIFSFVVARHRLKMIVLYVCLEVLCSSPSKLKHYACA